MRIAVTGAACQRPNSSGMGPLPHGQAGLESGLAEICEGGNDADERTAYSKSA